MDKIKLNLLAFKNAFLKEFKGRTAIKRCICIPIEDNYGVEGAKGVYFEGVIREKETDFSKAFVVLSIPKDIFQSMSKEEQRANAVIFANIEEMKRQTVLLPTSSIEPVNDGEDLPF